MTGDLDKNNLVVSYLTLRKTLGILGITLPFVLILGAMLVFQVGIQSSISSYYHTGMRDVLVGTLVSFGFFLFAYKGYPGDALFGRLAALFAIGAALFPTKPEGPATPTVEIIGILHLVFTIGFFLMLIIFSIFLFTKSDHPFLPEKKKQRNRVYRTCGILMSIFVLGIVIDFFFPNATAWLGDSLVFWLETGTIWAFGVSWFTKGGAIAMLNDDEELDPIAVG